MAHTFNIERHDGTHPDCEKCDCFGNECEGWLWRNSEPQVPEEIPDEDDLPDDCPMWKYTDIKFGRFTSPARVYPGKRPGENQ